MRPVVAVLLVVVLTTLKVELSDFGILPTTARLYTGSASKT